MAPRRKQRPLQNKGRKKGPPVQGTGRGGNWDPSTSSDSSGSRSSGHSSDDDSSSDGGGSDEDDIRDYKRGGYHPVLPYQLYNARYRVLSKLGAGAFSTVWLCADEKDVGETGPDLVAMKVCKSKKSVTEQALDEVLLLERLEDCGKHSPHVCEMRGHFWHSGPHGRHKCMVFEVMGENLLALVKHHDYEGLPLPMVRRLARHTLVGLEYIHSRGVIHTDVKLENVLVARHDLADLLREARRAHRAFMEQRSGLVSLSKSQKKRAKKKEKKQTTAPKAKDDGGESDGEDAAAAKAPDGHVEGVVAAKTATADGTVEASAAGADDAAEADQAAAEACGRPVPPIRQRERFESLVPEQVFAKLADFGNGCRVNKKVTDDIQTRQYRSPEVIIGADWDETADVWSAACMFFELITGDFLFDPRTGEDWCRDEDHLALMIELVGTHPPKEWVLSGKYSRDFFTNSGKLKHIKSLKFWSLQQVLEEKYSIPTEEAVMVSEFLMPMLRWEPHKRQTATEALKHRWVQRPCTEVDEPCLGMEDAKPSASPNVLVETQTAAAPAVVAETRDATVRLPATGDSSSSRAEVAVAETGGTRVTCFQEVQLEVAETGAPRDSSESPPMPPELEAEVGPAAIPKQPKTAEGSFPAPAPIAEKAAASEREAVPDANPANATPVGDAGSAGIGANVSGKGSGNACDKVDVVAIAETEESRAAAQSAADAAADELLLEEDAEKNTTAPGAGAKAKKKNQKKKGKK